MILSAFFSLMFTIPNQEVSCWANDCLQFGWTQNGSLRSEFTDFQCYGKSCVEGGWIAGGSQGIRYYTQCKLGGCFTEGWYYLDRDNHALLGNVQCRNSDCLKNGWQTFFRDQSASLTTCLQNDCKKFGWVERTGWEQATAYCRSNDCFRWGWRSF